MLLQKSDNRIITRWTIRRKSKCPNLGKMTLKRMIERTQISGAGLFGHLYTRSGQKIRRTAARTLAIGPSLVLVHTFYAAGKTRLRTAELHKIATASIQKSFPSVRRGQQMYLPLTRHTPWGHLTPAHPSPSLTHLQITSEQPHHSNPILNKGTK